MPPITLTPEQLAIVAHDHGPAVVFAVAGSGKTTAMVHRIERLVREQVFEPERILGTSFNRATVGDLERELARWPHCKGVETRTLNSLGLRLLAQAPGGTPTVPRDPSGRWPPSHVDDMRLLTLVVREARRRGTLDKALLNDLDWDDLLSYVGDCKGNLRYADLASTDLPPSARKLATQAAAPDGLEHYLDLYRLYEQVRTREGLLTFNDQLVGAWEAMHTYPELRDKVRAWYACVVVDEFQDVNLVQAEILRSVAAPEFDYMVVGDDDQTIYEWRGARPELILGFHKAFEATEYRIQDNFRCPAPQVALANRVIEHNRRRAPKRLHLTRGFDGEVVVHEDDGEAELGRAVVDTVQQHVAAGGQLADIGVLLRAWAQSAYIEHYLIEAGIPYELAGERPFYERREVQALTAYIELALYEAEYVRQGRTPERTGRRSLEELFLAVANASNTKRYISNELASRAAINADRRNMSVTAALDAASAHAQPYAAKGMRNLAKDITWLRQRVFRGEPRRVLIGFDDRVGYREYLRNASGFDETGEGRARNVTAFIDYAQRADDLRSLLDAVDELRAAHDQASSAGDLLTIRSIHGAKGLEWPVVIVPHCNEGTIPFSRSFGDAERLEEERRLLYVALTRAKRTTHLHLLKDSPTSRFLDEARMRETLDEVAFVRDALDKNPRSLDPRKIPRFIHAVHELHLERFLATWWQAGEARKRSMGRAVHTLFKQAVDAGVMDRLHLSDDQVAFWSTTFGGGEEVAAEGLGVPIDEVLPAVEERSRRSEARHPRALAGGEVVDGLEPGARLWHKKIGRGTLVSKAVHDGKDRVLVDFGRDKQIWMDVADEQLRLAAGPPKQASRGRDRDGGAPANDEDEALFEALRELRRQLSKERGVPAYVVCQDKTLRAIARTRPKDAPALERIWGVGPKFLEEFGDAFLEALWK